MTLEKITKQERTDAAKILTDYFAERGMHEYNQKWAERYVIEGHKKEVKSDEFFVRKEGNTVIGTVSLIVDVSGVAEIRDLVVRKEYRGKGYGKKMLADLINLAKKRKIRKLFALAKTENLFKSAGFEKEGALKSHFADGEDLSVMSKFLQ